MESAHKGLNRDLVNQIKILQLVKQYNQSSNSLSVNNEFDEKGNVIRDHKKELLIYATDEELNLLPNVHSSTFDSYRTFQKMVNNKIDYVPVVSKTKPFYISVADKKQSLEKKEQIKSLKRNSIIHTEGSILVFYKKINNLLSTTKNTFLNFFTLGL